MKLTQNCYIHVRNVGKPNDTDSFSGTLKDNLGSLVLWLGKVTMSHKIEITISREPIHDSKSSGIEELMGLIDSMAADETEEESPDAN